MPRCWTNAALAFVLAVLVGGTTIPRGERADDARADALGRARGNVQLAKRLDTPRLRSPAPRALDAAAPPAGAAVVAAARTATAVQSEPVAATPVAPSTRAPRARAPPPERDA